MAAGPLSVSSNASTNNDGILIGDKVYSEVYLTIDNSLIPEERLSPTPSMLDGLDLSTETDLRILGCELIQSAGILLRLPQVYRPLQTSERDSKHQGILVRSFTQYCSTVGLVSCVSLSFRRWRGGSKMAPIYCARLGRLMQVRVQQCVLFPTQQVAMGTGQVLFQRFFYSKSFVKHSFEVSPADSKRLECLTANASLAQRRGYVRD